MAAWNPVTVNFSDANTAMAHGVNTIANVGDAARSYVKDLEEKAKEAKAEKEKTNMRSASALAARTKTLAESQDDSVLPQLGSPKVESGNVQQKTFLNKVSQPSLVVGSNKPVSSNQANTYISSKAPVKQNIMTAKDVILQPKNKELSDFAISTADGKLAPITKDAIMKKLVDKGYTGQESLPKRIVQNTGYIGARLLALPGQTVEAGGKLLAGGAQLSKRMFENEADTIKREALEKKQQEKNIRKFGTEEPVSITEGATSMFKPKTQLSLSQKADEIMGRINNLNKSVGQPMSTVKEPSKNDVSKLQKNLLTGSVNKKDTTTVSRMLNISKESKNVVDATIGSVLNPVIQEKTTNANIGSQMSIFKKAMEDADKIEDPQLRDYTMIALSEKASEYRKDLNDKQDKAFDRFIKTSQLGIEQEKLREQIRNNKAGEAIQRAGIYQKSLNGGSDSLSKDIAVYAAKKEIDSKYDKNDKTKAIAEKEKMYKQYLESPEDKGLIFDNKKDRQTYWKSLGL